jgi:hypothetical protein
MIVRIVGDTSSLERSYKRAAVETTAFKREMDKTGRGALAGTVAFKGLGRSVAFASGAFLGAEGLTAAMRLSINTAADLEDQVAKTEAVFGASSDAVKAWSGTTADSLGLSEVQALQAADAFGALLHSMHITGQEAVTQSEALTGLAHDLAVFKGTSPEAAQKALISALGGSVRALRAYGIALTAARINQEAFRETGKNAVGSLTDTDKAQARLNLILQDGATAHAAAEKASGGLANQTRILKANVQNLAATMGSAVVPALNSVLTAINKIKEGPPVEDALVPDPEKVALVPRLALEYEKLRQSGVSAGDAIHKLEDQLGDSQRGFVLVGDAIHYASDKTGEMTSQIAKLRQQVQGFTVDAEAAAKAASGIGLAAAARAAAAPRGEAALGPGTRLGIALARAQLTPGFGDDLRVLAEQRALYATQIASLQNRLNDATGKKAKDLATQLQTVLGNDQQALAQITSIEAQIANTQAEATRKAAEAARKAAEQAKKQAEAEKKRREALRKIAEEQVKTAKAAIDANNQRVAALRKELLTNLQAGQYQALGLGPTGEPRVAGAANLEKRLASLRERVQGTALNTAKLRAFFNGVAKDLSGGFGQVTEATRKSIQEMFDTINSELDKGLKSTRPYFKHLSAEAIVNQIGGGLTAAQRRRLEIAVAGIGPGGTVPAGSSAAFAGVGASPGIVINGGVHMHGVQDMAALENEIARRARQRSYRRRGAR